MAIFFLKIQPTLIHILLHAKQIFLKYLRCTIKQKFKQSPAQAASHHMSQLKIHHRNQFSSKILQILSRPNSAIRIRPFLRARSEFAPLRAVHVKAVE